MLGLNEAANIILNIHSDCYIAKCNDAGDCYIFGLRKNDDEPERGLRGPYRVYKTSGKVDMMTVNKYLDFILEHPNSEVDIQKSGRRAS